MHKNMSKIFTTAIIAVILSMAVSVKTYADEKLTVIYKDGSTFSYILADKPKVTFQGNNLTITAPEISDSHKMEDVRKFVTETTNSIEATATNEHRITYTDNNTVRLDGFKAGSTVSVFNINGMLQFQQTTGNDGSAVIPLDGLAPGQYVIATTEGKSYKIMKL